MIEVELKCPRPHPPKINYIQSPNKLYESLILNKIKVMRENSERSICSIFFQFMLGICIINFIITFYNFSDKLDI